MGGWGLSRFAGLLLAATTGVGLVGVAGAIAPTAAVAADATSWVSDIRIAHNFDDTNANCPDGYAKRGVDLNDRARGEYEYFCLAYTTNPNALKVTNVWVVPYFPPDVPNTGEHPPNSRDGTMYCDSSDPNVIIEPVDLNSGVTEAVQQYVCFTRSVGVDSDLSVASGGAQTLIHDITSISFDSAPDSLYDECASAAGKGAFPMSWGERQRGAQDLNASLFDLYSPVYACVVGDALSGEPGKPFLANPTFADSADGNAGCPAGYVLQPIDLNQGAGGDYIYPCMQHTADPSAQHVQDVWAIYRTSTSTGDDNCGYPNAHLHDVDLNDGTGAGTPYIYLCTLDGVGPFTESSQPQLRAAVVGDIQFGIVSSDDDPTSLCHRMFGANGFPILLGGDGRPANFNDGVLVDGLFDAPDIAGCVLPAPAQPLQVDVNLFNPDGSRYVGGWTNHALTAVTACTGGYPPYVATPASPGTLTTPGSTSAGACRDAAGQTGTATSIPALVDTTPPVITTTLPPSNGDDDWYRTSPVTVGFLCTDAQSGLAANTVNDVTASFEGVSHVQSGACADAAGNTAGPITVDVKIDTQAPSMNWQSDSPAANPAGWHNSDVTVTWSCSDPASGVGPNTTATDVLTGEGSNLFAQATCTDRAGNQTTSTRGGYRIDRTAPRMNSQTFSRLPDHGDWYTSNVDYAVTCVDDLSGIAAQPAAKSISSEGTAAGASVDCVDRAGNVKTVHSPAIKLDKSPPTATLTTRSPANDAGWNNKPVDVVWTCTDGVSGVVAPTISRHVANDGQGQVVAGACENGAGLTTPVSETVNIDSQAPVVTMWADRPPDSNGWYSAPFVLSAKCVDVGDSGLAGSGPFEASTTISDETDGATLENSCTDNAGNKGVASFSWKLDRTPPQAEITSQSPAPTQYGWNRTDVTVTGHCSDALSGPVEANPFTSITGEGVHTGVITCQDLAGHTSTATREVRIDLTAPSLQIVAPGDGARYGVGTLITPDLQCADALSGIAECRNDSTATNALDTSAAGQRVFSAIAIDKAGNTTRRTITYNVADYTKTKAEGLLKSGVLVGVKATVTNLTTGKPVAGGVVHFFAGNGTEVCQATTGAIGTAVCQSAAAVLKLLAGGGTVTAKYQGDNYLMPSKDSDSLLS